MASRQSPADQAQRLAEGRCPVHGIGMPQAEGWFTGEDGRAFTVVACPRGDCDESAKAFAINGPWERLTPDARASLKDGTVRRVGAVIATERTQPAYPIRVMFDQRTWIDISLEEADRLARDLRAACDQLIRP